MEQINMMHYIFFPVKPDFSSMGVLKHGWVILAYNKKNMKFNIDA